MINGIIVLPSLPVHPFFFYSSILHIIIMWLSNIYNCGYFTVFEQLGMLGFIGKWFIIMKARIAVYFKIYIIALERFPSDFQCLFLI